MSDDKEKNPNQPADPPDPKGPPPTPTSDPEQPGTDPGHVDPPGKTGGG